MVVVFSVAEICSECTEGDEFLAASSNIGEYCTIEWTWIFKILDRGRKQVSGPDRSCLFCLRRSVRADSGYVHYSQYVRCATIVEDSLMLQVSRATCDFSTRRVVHAPSAQATRASLSTPILLRTPSALA
jgi:hypothetical protein